jgi:hypothetical protein
MVVAAVDRCRYRNGNSARCYVLCSAVSPLHCCTCSRQKPSRAVCVACCHKRHGHEPGASSAASIEQLRILAVPAVQHEHTTMRSCICRELKNGLKLLTELNTLVSSSGTAASRLTSSLTKAAHFQLCKTEATDSALAA